LEELLPKDHENLSLLEDGPVLPSEPRGFAPAQMVRCEECLRANPPTRVNCLYCAAILPVNESSASLKQPNLRPLEKWEQGYNNILLPSLAVNLSEDALSGAAALLKINEESLRRVLTTKFPMPLARAATLEEATLIERRLKSLGLETSIVSDKDLQLVESAPRLVHAAQFSESGINLFRAAGTEGFLLSWPGLSLLITGRLVVKQVAVEERKGSGGEGQLQSATETFVDEVVVDIYCENCEGSYRIGANSFDFSCLGPQKSLLASENFQKLLESIRERAPHAEWDDSYRSVRHTLEVVWPSEQRTESGGWRRERPGKYNIGATTAISNEFQFTRYSRLRYYLKRNSHL
jgi:hypothetical protein